MRTTPHDSPASRVIALVAALLVSTAPGWAQTSASRAPAPSTGDFFIVSSVNPAKQQILVKQPTEVTQMIRVDARTRYVDRSDQAIELADLRAGDTVYVTLQPGSDLALEIRKGPMTVAELQRRYLVSSRTSK
jgi:hypothetical protein